MNFAHDILSNFMDFAGIGAGLLNVSKIRH